MPLTFRLFAFLTLFAVFSTSPLVADEPGAYVRTAVVPVEIPPGASMVRVPDAKTFRFNAFTGSLRKDGSWDVHGLIRHAGLACANYQVGVRFGLGDASCREVNWITPVRYVTDRKQCNDAEVEHRGGYHEPLLEYEFLNVNCAELSLKCQGGRCNWARPK